jgi:hypothetical protein
MCLQSYTLRVAGGAKRADQFRNAREVARKLGGLYATVRSGAEDLLITVAVEIPDESEPAANAEALHEAALRLLPSDLHGHIALTDKPSRAHEFTAEILEDKRRGTPALPGALQAHEDLQAWEQFLARVQPQALLELGTATGSFSKWLNRRVKWFRTIDVGKPERRTPGFIRLDVWERADDVRDLIARAPRPFVLYCDNGDKRREVDTFAGALEVDDFLAVHDFGTDIYDPDIPANFTEEPILGLTAFYMKRAN